MDPEEEGLPYGHMVNSEIPGKLRLAKRDYDQRSVPITGDHLTEALDNGWVHFKTLKTKIQLRKSKLHGKSWEHSVWSLFAGLKFEQMNDLDGQFNLNGIHQIDVFAYIPGHVILIECKSKEATGKSKKVRDYLLNISGYRAKAEQSIKQKYGSKTKISWALATNNYEITNTQIEYAKECGINLLNEKQINYFHELLKKSGQASIYQILSYLFNNVEIPELAVSLPCLRSKLGDKYAYFFTAKPDQLLPISYISHRGNFDSAEIDAFQRTVTKPRLKKITQYVDEGGFFPNNLLLNLDTRGKGEKVFFKITESDDIEFGTIRLPGYYKTAWIIDGQHRLLSYANSDKKSTAHVPVVAFLDLPGTDQANMFVVINNKQQKVSGNILIELSATLKWGSPKIPEMIDAMYSRTMFLLNKDANSPLKDMITLTGDNNKLKPFTTNTIVTALAKSNPFGKDSKGVHQFGDYWKDTGNKEKTMTKSCQHLVEIVSGFLNIIKNECKNWKLNADKSKNGILVLSNQGISALIHTMFDLIREYAKNNDLVISEYDSDTIVNWITPWTKTLAQSINGYSKEKCNSMRNRLGKKGQDLIKVEFEGDIHKLHSEFNPPKLKEKLKVLQNEWKDKADELVDEMELMITNNIINILKQNYGTESEGIYPNWFGQGIPQEVQLEISARSIQNKSSIDSSFMLTDMVKIVQQDGMYNSTFRGIYGLQNYPQKGDSKKDKNLSWFSKLIKLRNKVKHPTNKIIMEEEYSHLKSVWGRLLPRISESENEM